MAKALLTLRPPRTQQLRRTLWWLLMPAAVLVVWLLPAPASGTGESLLGAFVFSLLLAGFVILIGRWRDHMSNPTELTVYEDGAIRAAWNARSDSLDVTDAASAHVFVDEPEELTSITLLPRRRRSPLHLPVALSEEDVSRLMRSLRDVQPQLKTRLTRVVRVPTYLLPVWYLRGRRLDRLYRALEDAGPQLEESGDLTMVSAVVRPDENIIELGVEEDEATAREILARDFPLDRLRIFQV